jgi:hypothetical protein
MAEPEPTYIHTDDFGLFARTEVQTRYEVDDEHDGVCNDECPADTDGDPSDLLAELNPVAIPKQPMSGQFMSTRQAPKRLQPTSRCDGVSVVVDD